MQETVVNYANTADGRALGFFPLSIATSLAIESAVGIHPDMPQPRDMPPPITQYKSIWINMRTLYRNIVGAMSKDVAAAISAVEIAEILDEEMRVIPDMLREYAGYPIKVQYYFNNLKKIENKYREADIRKDNSDRQKIYTAIMGDVMEVMLAERRDQFMVVDDMLPGEAVKTLIITHIAYDLLSSKNFGSLTLLESHTGRIKPKPLWYSKYYQGRDLACIPFTEELLQVFGDTETFHPLDKKLREAIITVAEKRNWHASTSRERIVEGIKELPNPAHVLKMKKIFGIFI
jgi:hypothetical protein